MINLIEQQKAFTAASVSVKRLGAVLSCLNGATLERVIIHGTRTSSAAYRFFAEEKEARNVRQLSESLAETVQAISKMEGGTVALREAGVMGALLS